MKSNCFKNSSIIILLVITMFITSCNEDMLDTKPLTEISDAAVWNDIVLAEAFVNEIYLNLEIRFQYVMNAAYVDEVYSKKDVDNFNRSLMTPDNSGGWINDYSDGNRKSWAFVYKRIRSCNLFLEKIDELKTDDNNRKERLKGEVIFLRAWYYHVLTSHYGGVPLITKVFVIDDNFDIARDTYSDCIKFIVDECDKAAALLPMKHTGDNLGRATKGAALALKSRVLLYAASDLHNTKVFPEYSNPELIGYIDENRTGRWKAAKDAAKAVIDMGIYSLYKGNPSSTENVSENFKELFTSMGNTEDIFLRYFSITSNRNQLGLYNFSNGYNGWGGNNPLGQMVDEYEMADGTRFDWNNPKHAAEPYKNREPRFYATILYEGAKFRQRPADLRDVDPIGIMQFGAYEKWNFQNDTKYITYGLESQKSPFQPGKASFTGYMLLKFLDPEVDGQFEPDDIPVRYIRYGEVLLNYVEACIELGEDQEARTYLNMIRRRAALPDVVESGDKLRQRYRHERRIELAFEEHRFHDVRRWVIGSTAYTDNWGVDIVYKLNTDTKETATIPEITPKVFFRAEWNNKMYFFPILRAEMNKGPMLIQNPGYN